MVPVTDAELRQELISLGYDLPTGVDTEFLNVLKWIETKKKEKGITHVAEKVKPSPHPQDEVKEVEQPEKKKAAAAPRSKPGGCDGPGPSSKIRNEEVETSNGAPKIRRCPFERVMDFNIPAAAIFRCLLPVLMFPVFVYFEASFNGPGKRENILSRAVKREAEMLIELGIFLALGYLIDKVLVENCLKIVKKMKAWRDAELLALVKIIVERIRKQHEDSMESNGAIPNYVEIEQLRNELILLRGGPWISGRSFEGVLGRFEWELKISPGPSGKVEMWTKSEDYIWRNESRIRADFQLVGGFPVRVWTWIPDAATTAVNQSTAE